jgi:hypothetical protein
MGTAVGSVSGTNDPLIGQPQWRLDCKVPFHCHPSPFFPALEKTLRFAQNMSIFIYVTFS